MEAKETTLNAIFNGEKQYKVPVFQRPYSWGTSQCRRLFQDLVALSRRPTGSTHFVGSIVYTANAARAAGVDQMTIIDGQQRITTLSLLLIALMRDARFPAVENVARVKNFYLVNSNESPDSALYPKLSLIDTDQEVYLRIVEDRPLEPTTRSVVLDNFRFLQGLVESHEDIGELYASVAQLDLVYISLSQEVDNPQLVFESLNSTGLSLSQTDLIRNLLLMDLRPSDQTRLYKSYWLRMESIFEGDQDRFDSYMASFLAVEAREFPSRTNIYAKFKEHTSSGASAGVEREALLARLLDYAEIYGKVRLGLEPDEQLREAFRRFAALDSAVLTPLLMSAYRARIEGQIDGSGLLKLTHYLESYLVRRTVCELRSNGLGNTVQLLLRDVDKEDYANSFEQGLCSLTGTARFPTDVETKRSLQTFKFYESRRMAYMLERLENSSREKEPIRISDYSVEHVMPQNPSKEWDQDAEFQNYVHVLGNLTITGYNAEMSNRSFVQKKLAKNGLANSALHLNEYFRGIEAWNEEEIVKRGAVLADQFVEVWRAPDGVNQADAPVSARGRQNLVGRSVTILDLISAGYLDPESVLVWKRTYLGQVHHATLDVSGRVTTADGLIFDNPFAAASHLAGARTVNGWRAWHIDDWDTGRTLEDVRSSYLADLGLDPSPDP